MFGVTLFDMRSIRNLVDHLVQKFLFKLVRVISHKSALYVTELEESVGSSWFLIQLIFFEDCLFTSSFLSYFVR